MASYCDVTKRTPSTNDHDIPQKCKAMQHGTNVKFLRYTSVSFETHWYAVAEFGKLCRNVFNNFRRINESR